MIAIRLKNANAKMIANAQKVANVVAKSTKNPSKTFSKETKSNAIVKNRTQDESRQDEGFKTFKNS